MGIVSTHLGERDTSFDDLLELPDLPIQINLFSPHTEERDSFSTSNSIPVEAKSEFEIVSDGFPLNKSGRKQIRFPYPRATGSHTDARFSSHVYNFTLRYANRLLNDMALAGLIESAPAVEDLEVVLLDVILERGSRFIYSAYDSSGIAPSRYDYTFEKAERCAYNAAVFLSEAWSPGWIREQQRSGRVGGMKSKRRSVWTAEDLAPVMHLSKAEQAAALGCSTATVASLRREAISEYGSLYKLRPRDNRGVHFAPSDEFEPEMKIKKKEVADLSFEELLALEADVRPLPAPSEEELRQEREFQELLLAE